MDAVAAAVLKRARERRQVEQQALELADMSATLRRFYHPKQRAFFHPDPGARRWRATRKTRRAGATAGGVREFVARALEHPGFRATYATTTRQEAIDRAWRSDTKQGFIDLLDEFGEPTKHPTLTAYTLGGMLVEVREGDLKLEFANGSQIELFGADNIRRQRTKRGNAKHAFWIDEAQDFPFLEEFFDNVVIGSLTDTDGEAWLTGTPGPDCVGMFFDITHERDPDEAPAEGWEVHAFSSVDNPFFGRVVVQDAAFHVVDNLGGVTGPYEDEEDAERAAVKIRWERTAGDAIRKKGWKGDEPALRREWYAEWVREDARYVYPIHSVPEHVLLYAPQRLVDNPFVGSHPRFDGHPRWYDHVSAVRDLPRGKPGHPQPKWMFSTWFDFGYHPDPFALVVWAFCDQFSDVFEMFSWKQTRVHTDDQGAYMKLLWDMIPETVSFGGDPAGKQDDFEVWRTRLGLPIEEANKQGKNTLEEFLADDIRRGRVHLRRGSPLHTEMKFLVYKPTLPGKPREVYKHRKVGSLVPGDHCCDAGRYGYSALTHYLSRLPTDRPPIGSQAAYDQEAEREERRIEQSEERRVAAMVERDEYARDFGGEWQ